MQPMINGLTKFDVAVLLEKAVLLNGMLVHGTPEQKEYAKKEWELLEQQIKVHTNLDADEMTKRELALEHDTIDLKMFDLLCE
ncbi:hypothetical protein [Sporosarcina cyprini]|uniref:hypothetical protein n=1 Tax=Sporosarcina cyprini TaxID=2910523 RepID=UPI001EDD08D6|nr:hypothetical protein [Sporosarcina cyprini]MCG3087270.1 hypothetical protein [Sporosarcina cyprini]